MLDVGAQAVGLHVDGALAGRAVVAGERLPRHGLAGGGGEQAQHVALAIRQPHDLLAALELPAREMEPELAEAHRFHRRSRGRTGAAQNAGDAQRKLSRLARLAHVVVGAAAPTPYSALRFVAPR